jgi:hypothetical protein
MTKPYKVSITKSRAGHYTITLRSTVYRSNTMSEGKLSTLEKARSFEQALAEQLAARDAETAIAIAALSAENKRAAALAEATAEFEAQLVEVEAALAQYATAPRDPNADWIVICDNLPLAFTEGMTKSAGTTVPKATRMPMATARRYAALTRNGLGTRAKPVRYQDALVTDRTALVEHIAKFKRMAAA